MFRKSVCTFMAVLFLIESSAFGFDASAFSWDPEKRTNIRQQMADPKAFLTPLDPEGKDESVGIPIASSDPADVKAALEYIIAQRGREALIGSDLYITGVAMGTETRVKIAYLATLRELGYKPGEVKLQILSVPKQQVRRMLADAMHALLYKIKLTKEPLEGEVASAGQILKAMLDRVLYFSPSLTRDYQTPLSNEIGAGIIGQLPIEIPVALFVFLKNPPMKATLLASGNFAILCLYAVFMKSLTNWLLRPDTGGGEKFMKQVLVGVPFTLNYEIMSNIDQFKLVSSTHWFRSLAKLKPYTAQLIANTGITTILQSAFYDLVITRGVRRWEQEQTGVQDSLDARVVSKFIQTPLLAIDSTLFMLTATGFMRNRFGEVFSGFGGRFSMDWGHVSLAVLTALGSYIWYNPSSLDPVLFWFQRHRATLERFHLLPRQAPADLEPALP